MIDLSIIIVSWNTKNILSSCLKSIYEQTNDIQFEIITIDNASNDDSVNMIKSQFPKVILIENSENMGFAAANNQGMTIAKGRYVLLLNSDTIILDHALSKIVYFADKFTKADVVGCRVLNADKTLQPTCFMFPSLLNMFLATTYLYKIFPRSRFFGREYMTWWDRNDMREVDVVTGCFMFVRREAIEQVGMMDEQFFMYAEEADWCFRFKQMGWRVVFAPVAEIVHLRGQSTSQKSSEMLVRLRLSILKFIRKHYHSLTYVIACLLTMLFFAVRIPIWFLINLFSLDDRKQSTLRIRAYMDGIRRIIFARVDK